MPAKKASESGGKSAGKGGGTKRKVNPALMKPLQPSQELGAVVGSAPRVMGGYANS